MDAVTDYDLDTQAALEEYGLLALREHGSITVRGCDDGRVYNSALWFAMAHGLRYVYFDGVFTMTLPD